MSLRDTALSYAAHGWKVLPLRPGTKLPLVGSSGVKEATTDQAQIEAWWQEDPDRNVGLATGQGSGIVVVDVDSREALKNLKNRHGELPTTATVKTRRGGHLYFRAPSEPVRNSAGKVAPQVDVRGDGGYVVAPPSVVDDHTYTWVDTTAPVDLPGWVQDAPNTEPDEGSRSGNDGHSTPYGRAVLDGEVAQLVQTPEGGRNHALFQAAVRVFELVKADQLPHGTATGALTRAAKGTGLPQHEIDRTLGSAWERAEAKPPADRPEQVDAPRGKPRFLTLSDLRNMPPVQWLIPQVLPEGFTVMYGPRSSFKTFLALDMSLTIASTGRTVVYAAGEGVSGLLPRISAWAQAHPDHDPSAGFRVLAQGAFPRLTSEMSVAGLKADMQTLADQGKPPALIVVDTWRRALSPQTVNDDSAVGMATMALDDLHDRHGTSALVIHHPRKPTKDSPRPPEAGSGALMDNADFAWKVYRRDDSHRVTLFNEKAKDHDEIPPLDAWLVEQGSSLAVKPSFSDLMGTP